MILDLPWGTPPWNSNRRIIEPVLLGEAYNTDIAEVVSCIRRVGERKKIGHEIVKIYISCPNVIDFS